MLKTKTFLELTRVTSSIVCGIASTSSTRWIETIAYVAAEATSTISISLAGLEEDSRGENIRESRL